MSEEQPSEPPQQTLPQPEQEEEEREEPVFDLRSLLSSKKGAPFGTGEVMAYAILADIMDRREDRREERMWKREQRMNPSSNKSSPEVEAIKTELGELRKTVTALADIIKTKEQTEAQKQFVEGVVKQTTGSIMPELQKVSERLEALEAQATSTPQPTETAELKEIRDSLKSVTDKLGEKVGAKGLTLNDVTDLIDVIETLEKRVVKKGEGGEVDYKTMAVSTVGEIGKELVSAWRDISTTPKTAEGAYQPSQPETPASTMQNIIKRQVQNYILARMEAGATQMNVQQAAQELALTPGQIVWAYNQLMKEGWFHVGIPSKKGKVKVKQTVQEPQTAEKTETPEEGASEESDQVFQPPPE
jgi:hypothetical protein